MQSLTHRKQVLEVTTHLFEWGPQLDRIEKKKELTSIIKYSIISDLLC